MLIRKSFKFNNMHIVRNCTSTRCSHNLHSHTYLVELEFTGAQLDNGNMIADFGLFKNSIKDIIMAFNNSYTFWSKDSIKLINFIREFTDRIVSFPGSPSAEYYSQVIFKLVQNILTATEFKNGEKDVTLVKCRVHETRTGYAETTIADDIDVDLNQITFSQAIKDSFINSHLLDIIQAVENGDTHEKIINPNPQKQIKVEA